MANFIKFSIALVLFCLMGCGFYDLVGNNQPNKCEMTYMFEYPEYIPISIKKNNAEATYGLYVYGEGTYANKLKKGIFGGIPALFIPGNGGSYKQVRSLGSVAYRIALDQKSTFHFDFFAVDFNEDLGALFGPSLREQVKFVSLAIRTIRALYSQPTQIILVGHSIGGLIARAVVTLPDSLASIIPLIITQASPHFKPVIAIDVDISKFYEEVNVYWQMERFTDLKNMVFVSIGAGPKDSQVPDFLTASSFADVETSLLSVPGCWLTTDHLAIVWCKQLILATCRALFDSVDSMTKKLITDRNHITSVFNYHLVNRAGGKHSFSLSSPSQMEFSQTAYWFELYKRQYHYETKEVIGETFLMIPIETEHMEYEHITILSKDVEWKNWIFVCKANVMKNNVRICSSGDNLSKFGRVIPMNLREINLILKPLREAGMTHIIVRLPPCHDSLFVDVDISSMASYSVQTIIPKFTSFETVTISQSTPTRALTMNISLEGLNQLWQSYILHVTPINQHCTEEIRPPIVSTYSKWSPRYKYADYELSKFSYNYIIETSSPSDERNDSDGVEIHIVLDPKCTYNITIMVNYRGIFQRLCSAYGVQIPAFITSQFLLIFAMQCKSLASVHSCCSPMSLVMSLSPILVVPFVKIFSFSMAYSSITTDLQLLFDSKVDFAALQLILFFATMPLSFLLVFIIWVLIFLGRKGAFYLSSSFLSRWIATSSFLPIAEIGVTRLLFTLATFIISISISTCGSVGLILACGVYFVKLFNDYENHLQGISVSAMIRRREISDSSIHFHLTLYMLLLLLAALNLPTLIMWIKRMRFGMTLIDDPSIMVCSISIIALGTLWQKDVNPRRKYYKQLGYLSHLASCMVITFGCVNLYRVGYIIAAVLLVVSLHQLLSPTVTVEVSQPAEHPSEGNNKHQKEEIT